jgi:ABC-type transport system involved in cytochrome c biogenesis ATPase subunit
VVVAALRDLSFVINRGERVALVGGNGAGKTTLLRTLAGIYEPVAGRLEVAGSVGSLIDPAAGMDQVSTGRENIMLRALFRGMDDAEALEMAEEIGQFSGLGEFLDVPVRSYSAGMQVRLSFAMATVIAPEVLLMDEWLLAGDADFMQRARSGWGAWWRAPTSWCWPPTTRRWRASGAPRDPAGGGAHRGGRAGGGGGGRDGAGAGRGRRLGRAPGGALPPLLSCSSGGVGRGALGPQRKGAFSPTRRLGGFGLCVDDARLRLATRLLGRDGRPARTFGFANG